MKFNFSKLSLLLAFSLPFLFVACGDDSDSGNDDKNLVQIASEDEQFSTLVAALEQAELVSVLEGDGPFTIFAPTNAAFTAAGIDLSTISKADLQEVLLYHVLSGAEVKSTDLAEGQTYATTGASTGPDDTQLSILIEKGSGVSINGNATVTTADVQGTNGVIHIIDQVLLPLDIVGHAAANSNFTSLVGALGTADGNLVSVLQGEDPFTVFAPLNSAFDDIATTVASLSSEQLSKVLTYHVAAGNVRSGALSNGMAVATVNSGEEFTINIDGDNVTITDAGGASATVVLTDVQTTNGVIHVLDKVIIPSNL